MNGKYRYLLLGLIAVIAALVFVPQGFLESLAHRYSAPPSENYLIQEIVGRVEKKALGSTLYTAVETKSSVLEGDTVITHGDSKALFQFNSPFWLMPYSKMEFLKKDGIWVGHLIYGELKKLPTLSNNDKIELVFENQLIDQDQFSSAQDSTLIATVLPVDSNFKDITTGETAPQNQLEKQIFQTLLLHKKFFQSCLVKYYKKKGGNITGGESVFDLSIDVTGAVEKARITKTDIDDPEYLQCLNVVFSRIRFKNLPIKEPLHALFPLSVELPQ